MNIRQMILSIPGAGFGKDLIADTNKMEDMLLSCCSDAGRHKEDLERIISAGGKRLRPMLAWVCWHLSGEKMPILPLMCMLELMHTSSLIHDDYVDQAELRRGVETISHKSGGLAAHECGDFLLAKAMEFLETYRGTGINEALSVVAQEMCLGELDQRAGLFVIRGLETETYYRQIRRKTALLMSESCRCGAVAGGASEEDAETLRQFGETLGMAFQIRDDLLDLGADPNAGKAPFTDLKDGVMTLPVILAQKKAPDLLSELLEQRNKTEEELAFIQREIQKTGAFRSAAEEQKKRAGEAARAIAALPDSPEKKALLLLVHQISEVSTGA